MSRPEVGAGRKPTAAQSAKAGWLGADFGRPRPAADLPKPLIDDACRGVRDGRLPDEGGGVVDPRDLPPKDRKDFYQSENERLKVETTMGALVPAVEVEAEMAELVKMTVQFIETLPDVLERKLSLSADQVIAVQERCDHIRQQLYDKITQDEGDGGVRDSA